MNDLPLYTLESYFQAAHKPCIAFNLERLCHESPNDETLPHRHDYYQIVVLDKGSAVHRIEFDTYHMSAGTISVLFPKQFHQITFSDDAQGYVIMFCDELFCSAVLKTELSAYTISLQQRLNYICPSADDYLSICKVVLQIKELYENLSIAKKEQIKFYIKIILLQLMELGTDREPSRSETEEATIFLQFKDLVEEQFRVCRTVQNYAGQLGITTKKLNSICNQYTGETALAVIHERTLLEIKRLLVFFDYSIKEIAFDLGFDSQSALNKFIASKANCTPSELKYQLAHIYK
ncbi:MULTISPECIES: AraC family transcriptional regulator [Bacteroides]|uniref:AraC family transcriptional regulator n=1 Tax=Bacteroides TaxID=816 RepID=UPI0004AE2BE5|nr:helix-turn-helix transcriptional regulator [Bacteroides neonati]